MRCSNFCPAKRYVPQISPPNSIFIVTITLKCLMHNFEMYFHSINMALQHKLNPCLFKNPPTVLSSIDHYSTISDH